MFSLTLLSLLIFISLFSLLSLLLSILFSSSIFFFSYHFPAISGMRIPLPGSHQSATSATSSTRALPTLQLGQIVILKVEPSLKELYTMLGVLELTASLAVKKFTLPALEKVGLYCNVSCESDCEERRGIIVEG
jgi:hypothetical protein